MNRSKRNNSLYVLIVLCAMVAAIAFCLLQLKKDEIEQNDQITETTNLPATVVITVTVTPEPTIEPTSVPTAQPCTPNIVVLPPPPPTPPVPTPTPTIQIIIPPCPTPTPDPTPSPTPTIIDPVIGKANFEALKNEIDKLLAANDLYIERGSELTYDLYTDLSLEGIDTDELFEYLSKVFIKNISHWIKMDSIENDDTVIVLDDSLKSAVCPSCGKVILSENNANIDHMRYMLNHIPREQRERANSVMLDFLYRYTKAQYQQRALIICDE